MGTETGELLVQEVDAPFKEEEVNWAMPNMRNGKAAGTDGITAEMSEYSIDSLLQVTTKKRQLGTVYVEPIGSISGDVISRWHSLFFGLWEVEYCIYFHLHCFSCQLVASPISQIGGKEEE